jgi:hypothetical protein
MLERATLDRPYSGTEVEAVMCLKKTKYILRVLGFVGKQLGEVYVDEGKHLMKFDQHLEVQGHLWVLHVQALQKSKSTYGLFSDNQGQNSLQISQLRGLQGRQMYLH